MTGPNIITCRVCGAQEKDYLGHHILEAHSLTGEEYLQSYPDAPVMSERLAQRMTDGKPQRRRHPPSPGGLTVEISGVEFPVNVDVPASACLPMPSQYQTPRHGELAKDARHALIALHRGRSSYVFGMPGSGKDAFYHAWSAMTRTPAMIRSIKPGTDIQGWFYSRAFDAQGTTWETGPLFDALTKGYEVRDVHGKLLRRVPYLILISDLDRADRAQAEYLRLIMDSIEGRVEGPQGKTYSVLPGTRFAATANSAGSGDHRGRMVSSNLIDGSIMDRFERVFQFHWMDWADEEPILQAKFPILAERAPWVFPAMGKCTRALRDAINDNRLHAEFSHRAVCSILGHAEDVLIINGVGYKPPSSLLKGSSRVWLDRLAGDEVSHMEAVKLMDPHIEGGMLDGDRASQAQPNWGS